MLVGYAERVAHEPTTQPTVNSERVTPMHGQMCAVYTAHIYLHSQLFQLAIKAGNKVFPAWRE